MKRFIKSFFVLFFCLSQIVIAQTDVKLAATRQYNSLLQTEAYNEMKKEADSMSGLQKQIVLKKAFIEEVQKKIEGNYSKVAGRIEEGKTILYITNLSAEIVSLQNDIVSDVIDNPQLLLLTAKIQEQTITKLVGLSGYTYNFLLKGGTNQNMISTKERVELLNKVQWELKQIRNMLLNVKNKIWFANQYGVLRVWNPMLMRKLNGLRKKRRLQDFFNRSGHGRGLNFY